MKTEILNSLFDVYVPVKISMETGYCGSDARDTIYVPLDNVLVTEKQVDLSVDQTASEMAYENAESYGHESEDCGECDGCQNNDTCEDPQDSQSVYGTAGLYVNESCRWDIDNDNDYLLVYSKQYGFWIALQNDMLVGEKNETREALIDLGNSNRKNAEFVRGVKNLIKRDGI